LRYLKPSKRCFGKFNSAAEQPLYPGQLRVGNKRWGALFSIRSRICPM
jgi:hypothetical protein